MVQYLPETVQMFAAVARRARPPVTMRRLEDLDLLTLLNNIKDIFNNMALQVNKYFYSTWNILYLKKNFEHITKKPSCLIKLIFFFLAASAK